MRQLRRSLRPSFRLSREWGSQVEVSIYRLDPSKPTLRFLFLYQHYSLRIRAVRRNYTGDYFKALSYLSICFLMTSGVHGFD